MALPAGFNPVTGTFDFSSSSSILSSHHNGSYSPSPAATSSRPLTDKEYDAYVKSLRRTANKAMYGREHFDFISRFGNWFDDHIKLFSQIFYYILVLGAVIGSIEYVFDAENVFYGIFRCVGGIIMLGISVTIAALLSFVFGIFLKGVRYCFWNLYTLLISLVVVGGLVTYICLTYTNDSNKAATEQVMTNSNKYRVTARELNIRTVPSKNGTIIGRLKKGDTIDVIDFQQGFAHIKYSKNGQYEINAYVSTDYIEEVGN